LKEHKIEISEFDQIQGAWLKSNWLDEVTLTFGTILSGEKLFADGSTIIELFKNNSIGKEALAGEMEGYGFAHTCIAKRHYDWLVVRGISDYGGQEKSDPINKKYQKVAALSAMTLLEYYLKNIYSSVNK
jgi:nucleoside phosphorylase